MGRQIVKGDVNGIMANVMLQAGIDPKTRKPTRVEDHFNLKREIKKNLRIKDEQDAVNRYKWYNFPDLTSQEIERFIYYKGQLCLFYYEPLDRFFIMPYALDGTIDFYGRFNYIHPVPFANSAEEEKSAQYKNQLELLSTLKLKVYYDIPLEELTYEDITHAAVIIRDYTPQLSQTVIPRCQLQDSILDYMAEIIPMSRTALRNSTGVLGMRVTDDDSSYQVQLANASVDKAVLDGQRYIPILGAIEFQDLANGEVAKAEEFYMTMQSMDTFRRSMYGLGDGSLFEKKSHMLEAEMSINTGIAQTPLTDGLNQRQQACDIANSIWGIGVSCEISETAMEADKTGNGFADDSQDQSGLASGNQPAMEVSEDVE